MGGEGGKEEGRGTHFHNDTISTCGFCLPSSGVSAVNEAVWCGTQCHTPHRHPGRNNKVIYTLHNISNSLLQSCCFVFNIHVC